MAYQQQNLGFLVKLNPAEAKKQIDTAFGKVVAGDEGRTIELAAAELGVSATSLKRYLAQLKDVGKVVTYKKKPPFRKTEAAPKPARPAKKASRRRP